MPNFWPGAVCEDVQEPWQQVTNCPEQNRQNDDFQHLLTAQIWIDFYEAEKGMSLSLELPS